MNLFRTACGLPFLRRSLAKKFAPADLPFTAFGLNFKNPVGLAAGFDKNAKYLRELSVLGFSHVEIGTVTPLPQNGNERPRLFRLPADKALINRMGFNNDGADAIADRLRSWQANSKLSTQNLKLIIGGNIGKNKATPNEKAHDDYVTCFKKLHPYVDYFVINVSSPNTPGLRELQEKNSLHRIISALQHENRSLRSDKPILLKIAPDLSFGQIDDVLALAEETKLDGLVVSNTTLSRDNLSAESSTTAKETGGLSGAPLRERAGEIANYVHEKTQGRLPFIGSGGIFTGADAAARLQNGATLVQVWTGFIYEGPSIVKNIMKQLTVGSWPTGSANSKLRT